MKISKKQRKKVEEVIRQGLVRGLGEPRPGETCLEGAISLAMGYPHGDTPSCVAVADRTLAIALNDMLRVTPAERAELLLPLGLAQLGTAGEDRREWVQAVVLSTICRVLPLALEALGLGQQARACREAKDLDEGTVACRDARCAAELTAASLAEGDTADGYYAVVAAACGGASYAANLAVAVKADVAVFATATGAASAARLAADAAAGVVGGEDAEAVADAVRRVHEEFISVVMDAYRAEGRA